MSPLYIVLTAPLAVLTVAFWLQRFGRVMPVRIAREGKRRLPALFCLALVSALAAYGPAVAADVGQTKTVDGLTVYLGIVPAQMLKGHQPSHSEAQAHGGAPSGTHEYHVLVAVFDAASGARIENAKVGARVSGLGLAGNYKTLEPMKIADTTTYGNYFDLPGSDKYRIDLDIERPQGTVKFEFSYDH